MSYSYVNRDGKLVLSADKIKVHQFDLNTADGHMASVSLIVSPRGSNKFLVHLSASKYPDFFFKAGPLEIKGTIIKKSVRVAESVLS